MTPRPFHFLIAFAAGCLLTFMLLSNGTLAIYGTLLLSSWMPHATGTVAALIILLVLRPKRAQATRPPLWAYLGGISGALTVVATSYTMNTALAISGTIAIGLAGQLIFSLIADARGMFGFTKRIPTSRDLIAASLITAGALVLILFGATP